MNREGTRDLNWRHIPTWAPEKPRIPIALTIGLTVGVLIGLTCATLFALIANGPTYPFPTFIAITFGIGTIIGIATRAFFGGVIGVIVGACAGMGCCLLVGALDGLQDTASTFLKITAIVTIVTAIPVTVAITLVIGFAGVVKYSASRWIAREEFKRSKTRIGRRTTIHHPAWIADKWALSIIAFVNGFLLGLPIRTAFGVIGGLICAFVVYLSLSKADSGSDRSLNPQTSWQKDRNYTIIFGVIVGISGGLALGIACKITFSFTDDLVFDVTIGIISAFAFGFFFARIATENLALLIAAIRMSIKWGTPVRVIKFLEDANRRGILRTVGPTYQFRHARLQDRLAARARDYR